MVAAAAKSLQSPKTVAAQDPLSMGFSGQEYWSGLPCPSPGDLPDSGIESAVFYVSCTGRRVLYHYCHLGSLICLVAKDII